MNLSLKKGFVLFGAIFFIATTQLQSSASSQVEKFLYAPLSPSEIIETTSHFTDLFNEVMPVGKQVYIEKGALENLEYPEVLEKIKQTVTVVGAVFFKEYASRPVAEAAELAKRAQYAQAFDELKAKLETLRNALRAYSAHEGALLSFFAPRHAAHAFTMGAKKDQALVDTSKMMKLKFGSLGLPIGAALGTALIAGAVIRGGKIDNAADIALFLAGFGIPTVGGLFIQSSASGELATERQRLILMNNLLRQTGNALRAIKRIFLIFRSVEGLQDTFAHKKLSQFFDKNNPMYDPTIENAIEFLNEAAFDSSKDVLSRTDEIAKALEYMKTIAPIVRTLPIAIAQIDAISSIAVIKENGVWTTPKFVEGSSPILNLKGVRPILIESDEAVANDINLGGDGQPQNALLSGPHGAGKSTIMRTVVHAILLSMALHITPASEATLSAFVALLAYLNIRDVIREGLSSYVAEKKSLLKITNFVQKASAHDPIFIMVDEPAAKTVATEAERIVYQLASDLAKRPNVMILLATHHEHATRLMKKNIENLRVLYPLVIETTPGEFKLTFKILSADDEDENTPEEQRRFWLEKSPEAKAKTTRFLAWRDRAISTSLQEEDIRGRLKEEQASATAA